MHFQTTAHVLEQSTDAAVGAGQHCLVFTLPPGGQAPATQQLILLCSQQQQQQRRLRHSSSSSQQCYTGSKAHSWNSSSHDRNLQASSSSSSSVAPAGSINAPGSTAAAAAAAADTPGWVPALFLGDVFITANTVAGIIHSSAAAAAEGRMPTARAARAQRDTAQQQYQQATAAANWPTPVPLDSASSLLLQLLQPLTQPAADAAAGEHPSSSSSKGRQWGQRQSDSDQQQQHRVFYVQHESAELVRQELLLHRYQELVAARTAAGLPTTPLRSSSPQQQQQQQPAKPHRQNMLQAICDGVAKLTSSSSSSNGSSSNSAVPVLPADSTPAVAQKQQQHPLGQLGRAAGRLVPPWMRQQQQQQPAAPPALSVTSSLADPPTSSSSSSAVTDPLAAGATVADGVQAKASSTSTAVLSARQGLPAVLAAQLQGFMSDLQHLEEDAVLREGAALLQQRQQQEQHGASSSSSSRRASRTGLKKKHREGGDDQQQQQLPFNFASYVARLPLGVAMQLLQQQQQQQQQVPAGSDPQQEQQQQQRTSKRQKQQQVQPKDFKLAINGSDLTACLAVRGRSAFVDFEGVREGEGGGWHLGLWESDDEDSSEDEQQQQQQQLAAPGTSSAPAAGGTAAAAAAAVSRSSGGVADATKAAAAAAGGVAAFGVLDREQLQWDHGAAAYRPVSLPDTGCSSNSSSSSGRGWGARARHPSSRSSSAVGAAAVPLNAMQAAAVDLADEADGEVVVAFKQPDTGFCDRTPVFQVPGLDIVLDTSYGEVAFVPAFLSLTHLASFLAAARTVATKVWITQRRAGRRRWQQGVQMTAMQMAGFSPGAGGSAAAAAAAAAAAQEEESDDDGMGEPPEAKAILEELGEGGSSRGLPNKGAGLGAARAPSTKGISGFLNALSLGVVSFATEAVCGVQEVQDRVALAVPTLGDWVHGIPSNINVRGLLLEDLSAAAAVHNAGKLQPPAAAVRASSAASQQQQKQQKQQQAVHAVGAAAGSSSPAAAAESLVDPLGLVAATTTTSSSSSSSVAGSASAPQKQQQQQHQLVLPPLSAPCLDGLRLLLSAGWMVASDVLANDGHMVELILQQPSGGLSNASIQFNEEGEVALRLALQVVGAPHLPVQPLQLPTTPPSTPNQQQQLGRRLATNGSSDTLAAVQQRQQQSHSFELGIHLNLTQLMGLPSTRHVDKLSAERAGLGTAARGVLLIGDLGLEPDDLFAMPWRPPPLGIGVLPAEQQTATAAAAGVTDASPVEDGELENAKVASATKSSSSSSSSSSSRQRGKGSS